MATFSGYFQGRTPSFACQSDPRFSYCLYVPPGLQPASARVLVAIHDTLRNNFAAREGFVPWADQANAIVVAPLFPAGLEDADDIDNYKYLLFRGIRFDAVLLAIVDEVAARYGVGASRFSIFGFSGGAHFAHRFLYARPERLESAIVASPGGVTLPTEEYRWWPGLADFAALFGAPVDWDAVRRVRVHLLVGARDTATNGIVQSPDHPNWVEGAAAAGRDRVARLRTLHAQLQQRGVAASFEELAGVAHEAGPTMAAAARYLAGPAWRAAAG